MSIKTEEVAHVPLLRSKSMVNSEQSLYKLDCYAEQFISGRLVYQRISPREQHGCAAGGETNVIASLLAAPFFWRRDSWRVEESSQLDVCHVRPYNRGKLLYVVFHRVIYIVQDMKEEQLQSRSRGFHM